MLIFTTVLTAWMALAQQPVQPDTAALKSRMAQLSFLVGEWEGEGWMIIESGQRRTFRQTEDVRSKLDGLVLVVEGQGTDSSGAVVHRALATISVDAGKGALRFRSHDGIGRYLEADASAGGGKFEWGYQAGPRRMRYVIALNERGQWHETGEMIAGDAKPVVFFEMTLSRK